MRKIINMILCLALILSLSLTALAWDAPDADRKGTLTFRMQWENEPLNSGSLTLYRVGQIVWENGGYSFALIPELEGAEVSLDNLTGTELPAQLSELAKTRELPPITQPVAEGEAHFANLQMGLYVVTQSEKDACDGFKPINPFLISLPRWNETSGSYQYDLIASPKVGMETEPTEPPTTEPPPPEDPWLPQTGQLNWPIPVMLASGLVMFVIGCFLWFGKKRRHES